MCVTLYTCQARPGKLEAVLSLYQDWQQLLKDWSPVSIELLQNLDEPGEMILLARFRDEESAWAAAESTVHRAWYARLVRLTEAGPIVSRYRRNPIGERSSG